MLEKIRTEKFPAQKNAYVRKIFQREFSLVSLQFYSSYHLQIIAGYLQEEK